MATNCTVDLPSVTCEGYPSARTALRYLLTEALDLGLQPANAWPEDHLLRVSLYLATDVEIRVRRVADALQQPLEKVITGLACARSIQRRLEAPTNRIAQPAKEQHVEGHHTGRFSFFTVAEGASSQAQDSRDSLQTRLFVPLMSGLNNGKIVFAEGGTGLGKSRIIARSALEYLGANKDAKVLILAPSVSVLSHLVREFRQVAPASFEDFSVVLGRGQFVSCKRLESLLSAPPPDPTLKSAWQVAAEWFASGGKPLAESERRLAHEFSLCWLADELRHAAPMLPVDDVVLGTADEEDSTDPAQLVYQTLRLRAFERKVKIVFATQAMACLNVWSYLRPGRQKGILPAFDLLLIDEAHELEEVMARTIGSSISFLHMRQVLRQGINQSIWSKLRLSTVANDALACLGRAENVLRQIPSAGLISSWNAEGDARQQTFTKFLKIARSLDAALEPFALVKESEDTAKLPLRLFREWHLAIRQLTSGRQNVWIDFSPVVRTPRVTVGPIQLIRPFEEFWSSCTAAGLLSGTLYLPSGGGQLSSGFLRMKLVVPRERAHEINPIHPSWNYTIPTVHLPDESAARTLLYPGSADDEHGVEDVEKWHRTLAARLMNISDTAVGGTLVLCCSYLDVRAFCTLLNEKLGTRLLASRGSGSMRMLSEEFVQYGRRNARPVWLATGSAWTGLDLSDHEAVDPAKDFTLTDLIITRIPFGFNKTAVHLARTKRLGFDVECMEAALRLKQGLGRLIRRAGVVQRRIWILDGRSHFRQSGYFKRVFGPVFAYPNQQFFK